jgi:hypothetical protein
MTTDVREPRYGLGRDGARMAYAPTAKCVAPHRERDALEPARRSRLSVAHLTIARHTFAADLAQLPEQLRSTLDEELRSAAQALRNAQALVELVYLAAIPEIIDLSRELAQLLARAKI